MISQGMGNNYFINVLVYIHPEFFFSYSACMGIYVGEGCFYLFLFVSMRVYTGSPVTGSLLSLKHIHLLKSD